MIQSTTVVKLCVPSMFKSSKQTQNVKIYFSPAENFFAKGIGKKPTFLSGAITGGPSLRCAYDVERNSGCARSRYTL